MHSYVVYFLKLLLSSDDFFLKKSSFYEQNYIYCKGNDLMTLFDMQGVVHISIGISL